MTKAIVLKWGDGTPYIRSFAHGLTTLYHLTTKAGGDEADIGQVEAALATLPADTDWYRAALATHAATSGSEAGWALLNLVHPTTREAWDALQPVRVTAGTLFFLADEAQPGWRDAHDARIEAEIEAANRAGLGGAETKPPVGHDELRGAAADDNALPETKDAGTPPLAKPQLARKADPRVGKLNETYALVLVGDKAAVLKTPDDGGIKFLTLSAFEQWLGNKFVQYQTRDGTKRTPLAKYWLHHPQRRQYEGIVFAPKRDVPGHYNLWKASPSNRGRATAQSFSRTSKITCVAARKNCTSG